MLTLTLVGVIFGITGADAQPPGSAVASATTASDAIYGIDDNNVIWEIDPVRQTLVAVNDTQLAGTNNSNSMAYDTSRDQFFFIHNDSDPAVGRVLLFWDRTTTGPESLVQVADQEGLGLTGESREPANAAYYDGAFWFLQAFSSVLHRVSFTYVEDTPVSSSLTTYDLAAYAAPTYTPGGFGDIAITPAGLLYGSHIQGGQIFTIDLTALGDTANAVFSEIRAPVAGEPGYQLSFDADYSVLYAHLYNEGLWYTMDTTTGALTSLEWATPVGGPNGFRDIGGASASNAPTTCEINDPGADGQTGVVGSDLPIPLSLRITDANGNPVEGTSVEFAVTAGDGNFAGASEVTVTTDFLGIAVSPTWTLGQAPGTNSATAGVGNTCTLPFTATGTEVPPAPSIDLVKAVANAGPFGLNSVIEWELVATNTGNTMLDDVTVADLLPGVTEPTCDLPTPVSLEPGEQLTCAATYTVVAGDVVVGSVVNGAIVTATVGEGGVPVTDDASSTVIVERTSNPEPTAGSLPQTGATAIPLIAAAVLLIGVGLTAAALASRAWRAAGSDAPAA